MLLWMWVYKYLFETLIVILIDIFPEVKLLEHVVILCWIFFEEPPYCFSHSGPILCSYEQCTRVPISPHSHQKLFSVFFYSGHLNGYEVVAHCSLDLHFLMISDVKHLFKCLLAICISSLEKCLFKFFAHFWIGLLGVFGYWVL